MILKDEDIYWVKLDGDYRMAVELEEEEFNEWYWHVSYKGILIAASCVSLSDSKEKAISNCERVVEEHKLKNQ